MNNKRSELLDEASSKNLPIGTKVEVTWSGGNGPCIYWVTGHARDGTCRLAGDGELRMGLPGMNWLDGNLGPKPLTEARIVQDD